MAENDIRKGKYISFFRVIRFSLVAVLLPLLGSCAGYGPKTIERDRMDYGLTIHSSIKQQLLGNIVRLRYMEAPIFVDVSSVINQYVLAGQVSAGAGFNDAFSGSDTGRLGASGRWEDRPTITYTPITGKKFTASLLTPVPPGSLFALVQSGWSAEVMFRLTVAAMNGVRDATRGQQADVEFRELLQVWARLRDSHAIALRRPSSETGEKAELAVYLSTAESDAQTAADILFLRETLGLEPDATEFALTYGLIPDQPNEIAVLTQSILEIMTDLAMQVDVPPEHVTDGRTVETFVDTGLGGSMFRVHYSEYRPEDAYVAIENRGYWFYIDDRDIVSKHTFGILQILLSLIDSGEGARGPVVSIGG